MGGRECFQLIYVWVWLLRAFLWVGVGGFDWVWMGGKNCIALMEIRRNNRYLDQGKINNTLTFTQWLLDKSVCLGSHRHTFYKSIFNKKKGKYVIIKNVLLAKLTKKYEKKTKKTNLFYIREKDRKTENTAVNCLKFANKEKSVVQFYSNNNALFSSRTCD